MKIRTRINALFLIAALLILIASSIVILADRSIRQSTNEIIADENLIRSATELRSIAFETALFHEARAQEQWRRKVQSMKAELAQVQVHTNERALKLTRIRKHMDLADAVFDRFARAAGQSGDTVKLSDADGKAFEARSVSSLIGLTQELILSGYENIRISRDTAAASSLAIRISSALIIVVMGVLLVLLWRLVRRDILRPLEAVSRGTQRIAASDYSYRLNWRRTDEIGELAGQFDAMSARVQETNQALEQQALELRSAMSALATSKEDLSITLNSIGDAVITTDRAGLITRMNPTAERLTGWRLADSNGRPLDEVFHIVSAQTRLPAANPVAQVMKDGKVVGMANHTALLSRDGKEYQIADSAAPIRDDTGQFVGVVMVFSDVTEKYRAAEALRTSLKEKEALLQEVHHRVKNNLQVISSLLAMEGRRAEHAPTKAVLSEMRGRIRSMALLHESVYRAGTFASIDLGAYLRDVATQAIQALHEPQSTVTLRIEMDKVEVGLDQATPCGLLLSELISNSLKHGFPEDRTGEVCVSLHAVGDTPRWCLRVSDSGVGLPADFEARQQRSLGLRLVENLAIQMGGSLKIGPGAVFAVTFDAIVPASLAITP